MNALDEKRNVLLEIADLKVHFDIKDGKQWFWQPSKTVKAVDGVTLRLYEGETLGVVAGICDKVLVMYAGRTMEYGKARDVFYQPAHPYSIGLLNAVPRLDAEGESLLTIPGNPPNLLRLPKGCPFQPRCPHAMEICNSAPPLEEFAPGRLRACFKPQEELV